MATLIFRYFLRYFSSTYRADLSRFRRTFHSFDPVGFAIFAINGVSMSEQRLPRDGCSWLTEIILHRSVEADIPVIVFSWPNCLAVISSLASVHPDIHVTLCVAVSDANTFLTSDWDMPNCRAICDGLMPALSAARTALTCPRVNETFATLACRWSFDGDCFRTDSSVEFGWMLGSNRPRRFASSTDAVMSWSSSLSVRYLTALGRSLGSTCLFEAVSIAASVAETRLVGGGEASRTIS